MFTLRAATLAATLVALAGCPSKESCPSGQIECGGACVDLQTDEFHCGSCLLFCGLGTCTGGACACEAGATPCTGPGAQCANLTNDTSNCNACRRSCGGYELCLSGVCTCVAPNLVCGTQCVPAATDTANCGACGHVCATGASCASGTCSCPASTKVCGTSPGACVAVASDPANCGDCGIACPAGATCSSGSCACAVLPAAVCGTGAGSCCKGTGCCGNTCQTEHSNGLGGSYFNCLAIGAPSALTYSDAVAAAGSWSTGTDVDMSLTACATGCYGRRNAAGTQYAIWCYGGSLYPGRVRVESAAGYCPTDANPIWN